MSQYETLNLLAPASVTRDQSDAIIGYHTKGVGNETSRIQESSIKGACKFFLGIDTGNHDMLSRIFAGESR